MGRSSGRSSGGSRSSSSSRGSLFGGSRPAPSAPSRGYSSAAAAPHVNTRNPTQSHAPPPAVQQPHAHTSAPHPQQHAQQIPAQSAAGGGMMSGLLGGVMQGMAFGGGSAVAHRAIDGVMGPRTVVHEHQGNDVGQQNNNNALGNTMLSEQQQADNGPCKDDVFAFNKCMTDNNNNFNQCQFMYDILSQCRRNVNENKAWQ